MFNSPLSAFLFSPSLCPLVLTTFSFAFAVPAILFTRLDCFYVPVTVKLHMATATLQKVKLIETS
jgi:hypothetical protein